MAIKVVKLTLEAFEGGKYKFFTTEDQILNILDNDLFTMRMVDAKTGKVTIHKDEIMNALKMYPTPPQTTTNEIS